jgi:hypothetical protein
MKNLYLTVEGQTEETFARDLLQPHLSAFNVFLSPARFTGPHGRRHGRIPRGGMFNTFQHALADMRRWLKENHSPDARFSMMVDLYHLPHDFPGYVNAMAQTDCYRQAELLEAAVAAELADRRFIPHLQVHEFEALVLSAPGKFADWFEGRQGALANLASECQPFETPERIDHGEHSHPKARIKKHLLDYDEDLHGPLLAYAIGLPTLRERCPHFGRWLTRLEQLDQTDSWAIDRESLGEIENVPLVRSQLGRGTLIAANLHS